MLSREAECFLSNIQDSPWLSQLSVAVCMADTHLQHCKDTASGLADPLQEGVPESVLQLLGLKLLSPWEDVCQRAREDLVVKPQIRKGKEPFQASNQDASWAHPRWDLLGMSHQDEAGEQTQVRLEQLHLLAGFWTSWCPPEELEKMVERGRSGLCLDCCPRDLDTWQKMYGLMDNKSEEAD